MDEKTKDSLTFIAVLAKELNIPISIVIQANQSADISHTADVLSSVVFGDFISDEPERDSVKTKPSVVEKTDDAPVVKNNVVEQKRERKTEKTVANSPDVMRRKRASVRKYLEDYALIVSCGDFPTKKQIEKRFGCDPFHKKTSDGRLTTAVYEREKNRFYSNKTRTALFG